MKEQDLKKGNKVLAEFMASNGKTNMTIPLNFHASWEILMPVVEKIESLPEQFAVNSLRNVVKVIHFTDTDPIIEDIVTSCAATKKESTWDVCVKFAEVYALWHEE